MNELWTKVHSDNKEIMEKHPLIPQQKILSVQSQVPALIHKRNPLMKPIEIVSLHTSERQVKSFASSQKAPLKI